MVMVPITEMYDLKTTLAKVGLIGIHSPTRDAIINRWSGLARQYKFYKLVGCNVSLACASILPADPLQVGDGSGTNEIAPQDLMNPILYRACTNEGWNTMLNRLYTVATASDVNSARIFDNALQGLSTESAQENLYYTLLASNEWKKAMPQSGLSMKSLKPFVYPLLNSFGNQTGGQITATTSGPPVDIVGTAQNGSSTIVSNGAYTGFWMKGRAQIMPRIPTYPDYLGGANFESSQEFTSPPKTFVGAIVLPPGKLHSMYFRMRVTWYVSFTGLSSLLDRIGGNDMSTSTASYYRNYSFTQPSSSKDFVGEDDTTDEVSSLETVNTDIDLVMEK